jgi:hypothetical protein
MTCCAEQQTLWVRIAAPAGPGQEGEGWRRMSVASFASKEPHPLTFTVPTDFWCYEQSDVRDTSSTASDHDGSSEPKQNALRDFLRNSGLLANARYLSQPPAQGSLANVEDGEIDTDESQVCNRRRMHLDCASWLAAAGRSLLAQPGVHGVRAHAATAWVTIWHVHSSTQFMPCECVRACSQRSGARTSWRGTT